MKSASEYQYVVDRNCPDVYPLTLWQRVLKFFGRRVEPRMVAYEKDGTIFCSVRTYAKFVEAGIVDSMVRRPNPPPPKQDGPTSDIYH